jgi:hypothetical protein
VAWSNRPKRSKENKESKSKSKIGEPEKTDLLEEVSKWGHLPIRNGLLLPFLENLKEKTERNF